MTLKEIFEKLNREIGNANGTYGLMGNLKAESNFKSTNLQNSFEKKLCMNDGEYTAAVDSGSYTNFDRDCAGYGLAQWTYWSRKQNLRAYAQSHKKSIGDMEMQIDFLLMELKGYPGVWRMLQNCEDLESACSVVMQQYERPADQSIKALNRRIKLCYEVKAEVEKEVCVNAPVIEEKYPDLVVETEESSFVDAFYPRCKYNGISIVDGLKSIGVDATYSNRAKIAEKNGIKAYKGTTGQNLLLLSLLKEGKLVKA